LQKKELIACELICLNLRKKHVEIKNHAQGDAKRKEMKRRQCDGEMQHTMFLTIIENSNLPP
jgi:hypothetical protein